MESEQSPSLMTGGQAMWLLSRWGQPVGPSVHSSAHRADFLVSSPNLRSPSGRVGRPCSRTGTPRSSDGLGDTNTAWRRWLRYSTQWLPWSCPRFKLSGAQQLALHRPAPLAPHRGVSLLPGAWTSLGSQACPSAQPIRESAGRSGTALARVALQAQQPLRQQRGARDAGSEVGAPGEPRCPSQPAGRT